MKIIEIEPLSNGAHRNQQGQLTRVPEGWAVIPESIEIPKSFPFVDIVVEDIKEKVKTVTYVEDEYGEEIPKVIISERITPTVKSMKAREVPEITLEPEQPTHEMPASAYDEMAGAYAQGVNSI